VKLTQLNLAVARLRTFGREALSGREVRNLNKPEAANELVVFDQGTIVDMARTLAVIEDFGLTRRVNAVGANPESRLAQGVVKGVNRCHFVTSGRLRLTVDYVHQKLHKYLIVILSITENNQV